MPGLSKVSIPEQLNAMQIAISNTLSDSEIQSMVAKNGYTVEKINEGKLLYESAQKAVNEHIAKAGAQYQLTAKVETARKLAESAYQDIAKVSRAVFVDDTAKLKTMGLSGAMPKGTAGFIAKAYTVFDNALNIPEIKFALGAFGYDEEKIKSEREKIANYDKLNQEQESAKGSAQQAKQDRDKALKEMNDWLAQYKKIAKVALSSKKQLLEKIGITARTTKTKAQKNARKKNNQ